MPADLKIASSPRLWWERLCSVPAVQRIVSRSFVLLIAWISALTIGGDIMIACRLASRFDSWWQIVAACPTTTWSSSVSNFVSSGMAHCAIAASSCEFNPNRTLYKTTVTQLLATVHWSICIHNHHLCSKTKCLHNVMDTTIVWHDDL